MPSCSFWWTTCTGIAGTGTVRSIERLVGTLALIAMLVPIGACSKDPEAAKRDYLASGDRYVGQNKLREAVIEYKNAIEVDGRYGEARFKLGNVYERLGDAPNALREFVRAADLMPEREDVQMKAADYLLKSGGFEDAKRVASGVLKKNGRNLDAQLVMANALAGLKDTAGAIREFEAAITLEPRRIATYLNLAGYYSLNGRATEALAVLAQSRRNRPGFGGGQGWHGGRAQVGRRTREGRSHPEGSACRQAG